VTQRALVGLLSATLLGAGAAEPAQKAAGAAPSLRVRLSDDVVKQAVRATLAESPREPTSAPGGTVLSGDRYQSFSRAFAGAQKPSCLRPDALAFQPAKGANFEARELMALPFWAAAIVKGKCN
jgi:hypothetical protein